MDKKAIPTDPVEYERVKQRIKSSVARWPNAYASGLLVQEYKRVMKEKGLPAYTDEVPRKKTALHRWYEEEWIDILTGKPCGAVHNELYYPTCRPKKRVTEKSPVTATELSLQEKAKMIKTKQTAKEKTMKPIRPKKTTG